MNDRLVLSMDLICASLGSMRSRIGSGADYIKIKPLIRVVESEAPGPGLFFDKSYRVGDETFEQRRRRARSAWAAANSIQASSARGSSSWICLDGRLSAKPSIYRGIDRIIRCVSAGDRRADRVKRPSRARPQMQPHAGRLEPSSLPLHYRRAQLTSCAETE